MGDRVADHRQHVSRWARLKAPAWFAKRGRANGAEVAWMGRNGIEVDAVRSAAFTSLMAYSSLSSVLAVLLSLVLPLEQLLFVSLGLLMLPLIACSSTLSFAKQRAQEEERAILRDSPSVIGVLSMSINVRPSLEGAVSAAAVGDGPLNRRLRQGWWEAMSGRAMGLEGAIMDLSTSLGELNDGLRQALVLTIASTKQGTRGGIDRLLDRANWLVLEGVREKGERYVASLSVPTMVLFAFGVLLPVMLFSLMPLMSVGSTGTDGFASPPVSLPMVALLMLVVFPACTFVYAQSVLRRHPLRGPAQGAVLDSKDLAVLVMVIAIGLGTAFFGLDPLVTLSIIAFGASAWFLLRWRDWHKRSVQRPKVERELVLALFLVGNHLASGGSFETALTELSNGKEGMAQDLCRRVLHQVRTGREDVAQALDGDEAFRSVSPMLRQAFSTVMRCAMVDPRAATRTALNLAQYLSDLQSTEAKMRERLQGVVDMMAHTATYFAPIVLAVTASLFQVVSTVTGSDQGYDGLMLIGGLYALELCAVVTYFNHMMIGGADPRGAVYQFAKRAPVAVMTYAIAFLVAAEGLTTIA